MNKPSKLIFEKKEVDLIFILLKKIMIEEEKERSKRCQQYMEQYFEDIKKQESLLKEVKNILIKGKWNGFFNKLKKFFLLK
jgi:hypothetical protein